ncbi:MAG: zinc ribbon domain-containing protein [Gemmatimonadetes bacterium]|nr:zinc ribbon domain-containing protein [Gemmatimonadota bacterium]
MDIVDRLYHQLHLALERAPGGGAGSPTIGDIYQHLIPYRSLRSELGIWELAEYEHALLRLLAGERGHVRVETAEVREEILRELAAPNPILGIYRDYPGVQVSIGALADAPPPPQPPQQTPPARSPLPPQRSQPQRLPDPLAVTAPQSPAACRSCGTALPDLAGLRFCPACGHDQLDVRCTACDASLAPAWTYCIRCGEPRGGGDRRERAGR